MDLHLQRIKFFQRINLFH